MFNRNTADHPRREFSDVFGVTKKTKNVYCQPQNPADKDAHAPELGGPGRDQQARQNLDTRASRGLTASRNWDLDDVISKYKNLQIHYLSGSMRSKDFDYEIRQLFVESGGLNLSYEAFKEVVRTIAGPAAPLADEARV